MEFGRIEDLSAADFSLPASHFANSKILGGTRAAHPLIYVGCPVWHDKGWNGILYPKGTKDIDHLRFYARKFNCIELNTTHYHVPSEATVKRWKEDTSDEFRFFPKIPQAISHLQDLNTGTTALLEFIDRMRLLENRLGTFFFQLPQYTSPLKRNSLEDLLSVVPADIQMNVELRHENWFANTAELDIFCRFLYKRKMGLVITDVAGRRDVLHQRILNKKLMIRFTANNLHPTDFTRMDDWILLIQEWISQGLEELQFFVHTPDKSLCIELALYFLKKMNLPYEHLSSLRTIQGKLF